jgi:hypothetical protein
VGDMLRNIGNIDRRTITVFFVIDTSNEMVDSRIKTIDNAIKIAGEKLNKISEYFLGAVQFAIEELRFSDIGQAFEDLLVRVNTVEDSAILLLLASKPKIKYIPAFDRLRNNAKFRRAFRYAIPICLDVDIILLEQFTNGFVDANLGRGHRLCREIHECFIIEMLLSSAIRVLLEPLARVIIKE